MIIYILTRDDDCLDPECCGGREGRIIKATKSQNEAEAWSANGYGSDYTKLEIID